MSFRSEDSQRQLLSNQSTQAAGLRSWWNKRQASNESLNATSYEEWKTQNIHEATFHSTTPSLPGFPLRRYYFRASLAIVLPIAITAYFIYIWRTYLVFSNPTDSSNHNITLPAGSPNALLIFYAWFIIGSIGLQLHRYTAVGTEAGMLMVPFWSARTGMQIMQHCEHTWSGPSGWLHMLRQMLDWAFSRRSDSAAPEMLGGEARKKSRKPDWPSRLWFLLAFVSMGAFGAIPLSGLTMEVADGFRLTDKHPLVMGKRFEDFNLRTTSGLLTRATQGWLISSAPRLPQLGILYTEEGVGRNGTDPRTPESMPVSNGTPGTIFLPAQGKNPIFGRAWGLALKYDCQVLLTAADFKILAQRNDSMRLNAGYDVPEVEANIRAMYINQSTTGSYVASNAQALWAIGSTADYTPRVSNGLGRSSGFNLAKNSRVGYFGNDTNSYPGLEVEEVLELQLWQLLDTNLSFANPPVPSSTINNSIDASINDVKPHPALPDAPLIGLRCTSSSAVGTASINSQTRTYTDFERSDTALGTGPFSGQNLAYRLSYVMRMMLQAGIQTYDFDWYSALFSSVEATPTILVSVSDVAGAFVQTSYLQADQLRRAVLRAYAAYALQLMYDGKYDADAFFANDNVTMAEPAKVLTRGVVPPEVVVSLLCFWTVGSVVLAVAYGFRRRWAEVLDGYSMFRFGADYAGLLKDEGFVSSLDYKECAALERIPGLIGDSRPEDEVGHVTLVERQAARKNKLYY